MKTKIVVENVEGRGVYIQVYDKNGNFFMGSPLSLKLPKEPCELYYTDANDLKIRHDKWENKCKDKIKTYLHSVFNHSLYGSLEINFVGFTLEKEVGVDKE